VRCSASLGTSGVEPAHGRGVLVAYDWRAVYGQIQAAREIPASCHARISATLKPMEPSVPHHDRPQQAARLAPKLRALAAEGVYFGTSSRKCEGWLGSVYSPERYLYDRFPERCRHLLESLAVVYRSDAEARERRLSPEARMRFHQEASGSTMEALHGRLERQLGV
jgi:hypothetical protein